MKILTTLSLTLLTFSLVAATLKVPIYTSINHEYIGDIIAKDTKYGLLLSPNLKGLTPGVHGFHVHQHPSCDHGSMDAGAHLDPSNTGKHLGPYNDKGHLGDLPALTVNSDGVANLPVVAPRLKTADIKEHALMIHVGGDNYSDNPKLGGGGDRFACGVVK